MINTLFRLLRLQELNFVPGDLTPAEDQELADLEATLPETYQRRVNGFLDRGRKGVVPMRGTSCSGCNIQISRSIQIALKQDLEIQICDQCGRFLFLAEGMSEA